MVICITFDFLNDQSHPRCVALSWGTPDMSQPTTDSLFICYILHTDFKHHWKHLEHHILKEAAAAAFLVSIACLTLFIIFSMSIYIECLLSSMVVLFSLALDSIFDTCILYSGYPWTWSGSGVIIIFFLQEDPWLPGIRNVHHLPLRPKGRILFKLG